MIDLKICHGLGIHFMANKVEVENPFFGFTLLSKLKNQNIENIKAQKQLTIEISEHKEI